MYFTSRNEDVYADGLRFEINSEVSITNGFETEDRLNGEWNDGEAGGVGEGEGAAMALICNESGCIRSRNLSNLGRISFNKLVNTL